jgi:hypothetical protein
MLVVFFLSSLKKIVEQMHQTMCKREITVPFVNFKHNIKSECANITGCRHVYFEHIAIIVVDFFFIIRIRPSRITPMTAVVILGCCFPAFNSSACIMFGFYSIW